MSWSFANSLIYHFNAWNVCVAFVPYDESSVSNTHAYIWTQTCLRSDRVDQWSFTFTHFQVSLWWKTGIKLFKLMWGLTFGFAQNLLVPCRRQRQRRLYYFKKRGRCWAESATLNKMFLWVWTFYAILRVYKTKVQQAHKTFTCFSAIDTILSILFCYWGKHYCFGILVCLHCSVDKWSEYWVSGNIVSARDLIWRSSIKTLQVSEHSSIKSSRGLHPLSMCVCVHS